MILQVFWISFLPQKLVGDPPFPSHTHLNRVNQPPLATLLLGVEGRVPFLLGPLFFLGSGLRPPPLNRQIVFFFFFLFLCLERMPFLFVCLTVATVEHKFRVSCNMIN